MFRTARFRNRREAGKQLAERIRDEMVDVDDVVVIGLPRGGVEVAYEVARALGAPLDVIVARKIGAPSQPELGIGAVAPGDITLLDHDTVEQLGLTQEDVRAAVKKAKSEMDRRIKEYRGGSDLPELDGKTAVIIDDGLATGVTALAAIRAARTANPNAIVLAVPVCAEETAAQIAGEVDRLICLVQPSRFMAVGVWYDQFDQTTDATVIELLEEAREAVDPEEMAEP